VVDLSIQPGRPAVVAGASPTHSSMVNRGGSKERMRFGSSVGVDCCFGRLRLVGRFRLDPGFGVEGGSQCHCPGPPVSWKPRWVRR
jgi:hypothetical protein